MPACHARSVQQACSSKGRVYVCARALRVQWVVLDVSASIAANIHVSNVHFAPSRGRVRVTSSNQHIASKPITHHVYNDARLQPRACSEYSWDIPRTSNWTEENGKKYKSHVHSCSRFPFHHATFTRKGERNTCWHSSFQNSNPPLNTPGKAYWYLLYYILSQITFIRFSVKLNFLMKSTTCTEWGIFYWDKIKFDEVASELVAHLSLNWCRY